MLTAIKFRKFNRINKFDTADNDCLFALVHSYGYPPYLLSEVITKGADVDAQDSLGYTPLMILVQNTQILAYIRELVEYGADTDMQNVYGDTALELSLRNNRPTAVTYYLFERGARLPRRIQMNSKQFDLYNVIRTLPCYRRERFYHILLFDIAKNKDYNMMRKILDKCSNQSKNAVMRQYSNDRKLLRIIITESKKIFGGSSFKIDLFGQDICDC